jgi:hypothetical protein
MTRTITLASVIAITGITAISLTSCKGKKATREVVGTEIKTLPCQGPKYTTDDKYFRASQIGTSSDISLAKEKALTLAKQQLAGSIESKMKSVTDRYVNEREIQDKAAFSQKFENLTREIVDQTLFDIRTVCEQLAQLEDGKFRCFIALEIEKKAFFDRLNGQISRQELIQLEFDKQQFQRIFDEEMRKVEEAR